MPEARLDGCLQWSHLSSGHTGADCSVDFFCECFYSGLTLTDLKSRMKTIVDACGCHASKQSDSRDRGLISSLPIPYCTNSLLYVDFIHSLPRFGGYDSCLMVTCGLSRFTRVFPCNKKITGEQTVKMLVEQWFEPYGAPKQVHSDLGEPTKSGGFLLQGGTTSKVLSGKVCPPFLGTSVPTVRTPDWLYPSLQGYHTLSVLRMFVCVSLHTPAWLPETGLR